MRDGYDIVIRDDPKIFSEACIKLLTDRESCNCLGSAARATMAQQYLQSNMKDLIQKIIEESF